MMNVAYLLMGTALQWSADTSAWRGTPGRLPRTPSPCLVSDVLPGNRVFCVLPPRLLCLPTPGTWAGCPLVFPEPLASSDAPHPAARPGRGVWKSFPSKVLNPALHYQPSCAPTMGDFLTGGPGPPLLGNKLRISRREEPQGKQSLQQKCS